MSDDRNAPAPRGHDISAHGDRYEALAEFLEQHASQSARDRARAAEVERRRGRGTRRTTYVLLVVLAVLAGWLWLFPPAFLRVEPPPPQPIEQEESALRFTMYLQAQRIAEFRRETGRYPQQLEETGPPLPAMEYTRLSDDLYQLTARTERLTLTYRSDLPLDEFLGTGAELLEGAGGS